MNTITVLVIIALVVLSLVIVWHFFWSPSASTANHSIVFEGATLFASDKPILTSSDGIDTIVYTDGSTIKSYNTETKKTTVLSDATGIIGLAYDPEFENFMSLNKAGLLMNITAQPNTTIQLGVSKIYDVEGGGYYIEVGGEWSTPSGSSKKPANGSYDFVEFVVK